MQTTKHKNANASKLTLLAILLCCNLACAYCVAAFASERDYGRTCVALAMFLEARSEGVAGMTEVGNVVMRRYSDPGKRFGDTLCEVVMQPEQFAALAATPVPRHPERMNPVEWEQALEIADGLIASGMKTGLCNGALYFNQTARKDAVCHVGVHYFYAK